MTPTLPKPNEAAVFASSLELNAEYAAIPQRLADATDAGDAIALVQLTTRYRELPLHVLAAEMLETKTRAEQLEARLPEMEQAAKATEAPLERAQSRKEKADAEWRDASENAQDASSDLRNLKMEITQTRHALNDKRHQLAGYGGRR